MVIFSVGGTIISIHAPVKGATKAPLKIIMGAINFNPRTREGCDVSKLQEDKEYLISIHAPVKGATVRWLEIA